jgi:putative ABC transport system permease protein
MTTLATRLLERLLGRLPVGWLQLVHNPMRLAAALAGVAFANVLVFMQLGFLGALIDGIALPYRAFDADILVSASDTNTLADASPLPRQRMYEALAVPGVARATPLYYGKLDWKQPDGTIRTLDVFGIDPTARAFRSDAIARLTKLLELPDTALMDRRTRNVDPALFAAIDAGTPYRFEVKNRTLSGLATFEIGGGFGADGYLIVSDQTFFRLFPARAAGAPNHILVVVEPGIDLSAAAGRLDTALTDADAVARTAQAAAIKDQRFQTTQRPVGLVFGFGIVIGTIVGAIIVYQVLSSDVADHLREYATFKAMGYGNRFFMGIVVEEAAILAILGFVPGIAISIALYAAVAAATGLPVAMTAGRPVLVFAGTLAMCVLAGFLATRRLVRADPADLF